MDVFLALALSTHLGLEGKYNEVHPQIRIQQGQTIGGAFYNSVDRISVYGGYEIDFGAANLELGVTSGYPAFGEIVPFVRGTYEINENVVVFAAPTPERLYGETVIGAVIGVELRLK